MDDRTALVTAWLNRAAVDLDAACDELTRLDAARGDADHGVNMQRGFAAAATALAEAPPPDAAAALRAASDALRRTVGGTSGPLWSLALRRIGKAFAGADDRSLIAVLADGLASAAAGVSELGGAGEGDGTTGDA
ncbi:MAG: DAK2 domain-containing protein, partial [Actinobacteria bacterium]|nr:DAK2 domain-containing protein [Actinomycetota bacterium]